MSFCAIGVEMTIPAQTSAHVGSNDTKGLEVLMSQLRPPCLKSWQQRTAIKNAGHQWWPQLRDQREPKERLGWQPASGNPAAMGRVALGLQTPQLSFVIYQWKRPPLALAPNKIPPPPIPGGSWELSAFRFYKTSFLGGALQASVRFMNPA